MNARTHSFRLAAAALALAGSFTLGRAAEDVLWTWDDAQGTWGTAWGQAQTSWDSTQDNTGNGGGSLHIVSDFGTPPAGEEYKQNVITVMGNFGGWVWNGDVRTNLLEFETLEFDLKWDTGNATLAIDAFNNTGGDNGLAVLSARYVAPDWDWSVYLSNVLVPEAAADGWQHIVIPINPLTPNLDECAGLMFKKWVPEEISNAGGTAAFWIDNVHLVAKAGEIPPPTMSAPTPATPGLNLLTLAGSQWQRQGIRTVGDNFSWVGSGGPTTYEFTVRELPSAGYAGFQTHMFLVARDPRTGAGPDWSQPDVIFLDMQVQGDGSCVATFRYKIDLPDNNGFMYGDGALGTVSSSTGLGTWGITFNDDKNFTIFSPEGATDLVLPDEAVAKFDDAVTVYFGCQPNATERIGQKTVLGQARISGAVGGTDITDDFPGPLDTDTWELAAENPAGIMILNDDAAFWLGWSLPDTGFGLQATTDVVAGEWNPYAGATSILPTGATKSVLIARSGLPGEDMGYWRLAKRMFTQLQILWPGESNAPGTPTGKTGTPDPVPLFSEVTVTINAVAQDYAVMRSVTDTVHFASSDPNAFLPEDLALVSGTATAQIIFFTEGPQTITVSDVTDPGIDPGTSTEVVPTQ